MVLLHCKQNVAELRGWENLTIGEKLVELRGNKSIEVVAKATDVTTQAIWNYENNKRVPRDEIKIRLAAYYGVPVGEIFFNENSNN